MELRDAKIRLEILLKDKCECPECMRNKKAYKTVLQALKDSIPKKKIEDKIKELKEKYNNSVNDVYKKPTESLIDFQRIVGAQKILQELLEDK